MYTKRAVSKEVQGAAARQGAEQIRRKSWVQRGWLTIALYLGPSFLAHRSKERAWILTFELHSGPPTTSTCFCAEEMMLVFKEAGPTSFVTPHTPFS